MKAENHVPNTTQVGIAPTRLPPTMRTRLAGWCKIGIDFCNKVGAPRVGQLIMALELALLDLAASELRLQQLERRARKAESELAGARAVIEQLRQEAARVAAEEFVAEPTRVRPDADPVVARCRTVEEC
jgi:hypothetical protein